MANNTVTITRIDCNTYRIKNDEEVVSLGVRVDQLVDGEWVEGTYSDLFAPTETYDAEFSSDGIYRIVVSTEQDPPGGVFIKSDYYDLLIYCSVQTCMATVVKSFICDDAPDCDNCVEEYNIKLYYYNALMVTWWTLMMQLNGLYVSNWAYTTLDDDTTIPLLSNVETLLSRISGYCNCIAAVGGDSDCGCS